MTQFLLPLLGALVLAIVVMTLVWWRQLYTKNASIVDAWWAYNFGFIALLYDLIIPGEIINKLIITVLVVAWSFRLGTHLLVRNTSHAEEDIRYRKLREEYGENERLRMWVFFMYQAISNVVLSVPFLLTSMVGDIKPIERIGILIWCLAVLGETLADHQLNVFKREPANKGKVCQKGLWNYSRHPNYFFEWLIWVSYALIALASPFGWIGVISPVLMYFMLTKVTGIPMLEALAITRKGQAYVEYQKTTSAFFPLPKRKL